MTINPELKSLGFTLGDRVIHTLVCSRGGTGRGTITKLGEYIEVSWDKGSDTAIPDKVWSGKYDANWFRIHPDGIVKAVDFIAGTK